MELYNFKTTIENIVDGDTFDTGNIELGFNALLGSERLRLYGVNAFETRRRVSTTRKMDEMFEPGFDYISKGEEAKEFAIEMLLGKEVIIQSIKLHKYRGNFGRILARVFVGNIDFGDLLIRKGLAYKYV